MLKSSTHRSAKPSLCLPARCSSHTHWLYALIPPAPKSKHHCLSWPDRNTDCQRSFSDRLHRIMPVMRGLEWASREKSPKVKKLPDCRKHCNYWGDLRERSLKRIGNRHRRKRQGSLMPDHQCQRCPRCHQRWNCVRVPPIRLSNNTTKIIFILRHLSSTLSSSSYNLH